MSAEGYPEAGHEWFLSILPCFLLQLTQKNLTERLTAADTGWFANRETFDSKNCMETVRLDNLLLSVQTNNETIHSHIPYNTPHMNRTHI